MRRICTPHLLLLLFLLALANPLVAQQHRQVEVNLQQLDEYLRFAAQLAESYNDPNLTRMLQEARQFRNQAANSLSAGQNALASSEAAAARRLADQVIRQVLQNPVRRLRDQLQELLRRAEQVVVASGNRQAERLLNEAKIQQSKAAEAWRQNRYQVAAEHYKVSTYLAQRSIDLVEGPTRNLADRVAEQREQYRVLLNTAEAAVARSGEPTARRVLNQAKRQIVGAAKAFNRKEYALALDLYHRSTRLLLRAINIAQGEPASLTEQAVEDVHRVDELIASTEEKLHKAGDSASGLVLRRAKNIQERAHGNLRAGFPLAAMRNAQLAEGIIIRLARRVGRPSHGVPERVLEELDKLQSDLEETRWRVEQTGNEEARALVDEAGQLARLGQEAVDRGHHRLALESILAANRLLLAAERIDRTGTDQPPEASILASQLEELDASLEEAEEVVNQQDEEAMQLLRQARRLRDSANEALQQGKNSLAANLIQTGLALSRKAMTTLE